MRNRIIAAFIALAASVGMVFGTAVPASASSTSCTATNSRYYGLHATALRQTFSDGTSITASATGKWTQVVTGPDIVWTFKQWSSITGLDSRTSNPTVWGGSAGNRLPRTSETIMARWTGRSTVGVVMPDYAVCSIIVPSS